MKRKSILFLLLMALMAPWAANAQTTLWSENFEGGSMPTGWTTDGPGTWSVGSGDYSTSTGAGQGTYNALITHGTTGSVTKLITPAIDLSSVTSAVLSFMHVQRSWAGDVDELRVYYRTSSSDTWTQLVAYTSAVASWTTEVDIILPNTSATYQLAFEHTDNYGYGVGLDDIRITPPASCPKPTELTCTAYTTTTATLAWTESGEATSWVLEYGTAADFTGATSVNVSGTPSKELTGLTAETTYYARVKADCGGGDQSDWSNTCEFRPSAAQIVQIGEGESASTYLPAYTFYNNNLTEQLYTAEEVGMNGDIVSLAFYNAGSTKTPNIKIYLVNTDKEAFESTTDWLTVTADDLVFEGNVTFTAGEWTTIHFDNSFYYDGNSNLGLVVDEAMSYSSGLSCRVFTSTDNCSLYHYDDNVDFDATNPSSGNYNNRLSVKNQIQLGIIPGEAPSCPKPRNLTVSNVTSHTADLSWTSAGEETAWQICLNGDERNPIDVTTTSYTLTGLTAETTYYVKVRANCGSDDDSDWTNEISFPTDIACPAPTALEVVPTPISATVTWTGDASNYTLRYGTCAEPDPTQPATIIFHADDIWQDGSGYQMLLDADATAFGTIIPETGALSTNCSGNEDIYAEFEYKIPANADGECTTSNVVINNTITLQIPAGTYDWCITNPTPGDRIWIASAQGSVGGRKDDYVFEAGMIYEFNMYMLGSNDATDVTIMCSNVDWTYVNNATSPYTIEGLDPETEYFVGVQAVCGGEDGESAWTNATFTTPSNCEAPHSLNVPEETLMPTTAGVEWTGYQDGFEVWYRPVAEGSPLETESFEGSLNGWTTIDADGDNYNWVLASELMAGYNIPSHEGEDCVSSQSYDSDAGALTPDNYLVSPQVALGGSITFWASAQDAAYAAEHFGVAVSTTSNTDASAFTTIQEWTMTAKKSAGDCKSIYDNGNYLVKNRGNRASGEWYQYTVDLSAYAGQTGYVAIRHFNCSDMFYLNVDDITIYGPAGEEQEWMQATTDGTSIILGEDEALIPETTYECKVRGENRSCGDEGYTEFSETINFTTPGLCDNPNTFTFETLEATTATLNWIGYQESYNVLYRTAEVGVMLWEDFSNGASGWTASDLNEQSSIYTLGSGEDTWNAFGFVGDGTTQYLISPELESSDAIADSLYFYYYAYQGSTQTFKVGFSETYSLDGFTWGDEITTSSSDYYGYYEGVIPAGTKYFAIQSSGESSYLFVTDFYAVDYTNYVAPGEWVELTVNEPSVTMQPLTPNTVYDVYVQGICGEGEDDVTDWMGGYFTTPELTTLVQTIELAEGSNWISFYVETDLDALKAALEEVYAGTNMTIRGMNGYTSYNGTRWRGPLTSLDMSQMYMIEVAELGRIVVEGEPLNPADLAITINEGANWIGFPFSESMAIQGAFEGFATNGDILRSQDGYTTYNGTRWRGNISILVPGQGYIYNSTTNKDDFYYPTNTSKAGQTTLQLKPFAKNRFEKKSFVPANIMPISK